jgi:hypothetical protein
MVNKAKSETFYLHFPVLSHVVLSRQGDSERRAGKGCAVPVPGGKFTISTSIHRPLPPLVWEKFSTCSDRDQT